MALRGFFKQTTLPTTSVNNGVKGTKKREPKSLVEGSLKKRTPSGIFDCTTCGLDKTCQSPYMPLTGEGLKDVLIIAEAPGQSEDEQNTQLIGKAGQLLRDKLFNYGLDLDRDFWKTNSVRCRPIDNETPTPKQLKSCKSNLEKDILEKNPKFIWLMGKVALDTFYEGRDIEKSKVLLNSWTKLAIPDRKYNCWVFPMYHPSAVLRNQDGNFESYFDLNLKWAISCLQRERPVFQTYEDKVVILENFEEICYKLEEVKRKKPKRFVFDYETSGVKPYRKGHKIYAMSFFFEGLAYAFAYDYPGVWSDEQKETLRLRWKDILEDPEIGKVAHNFKYEHKWSQIILNIETVNWLTCTMIGQHILDSRDNITGLKIQAFLRWGIEGYERDVKPYMETAKGTEFNRLHEFPLKKLLTYNALDSLFEANLDVEQEIVFNRMQSLRKARDFFIEGALALVDAENRGITVNEEYYKGETERLQNNRKELIQKLKDSPEAKKFEEVKGRPLSLGASESGITNDVKFLFFEIMKIKSSKQTAKGNASVDDEVLSKVDSEFVRNFLKVRKIKKVLEYIEQYTSQVVDGLLHPNFNLHLVKTFRSSSDQPNFQNVPKHDLEASKSVRTGIIPKQGYILMEADFSSLEVRGNAMYSLDPELLHYLEDSNSDMHRDQALDIFILTIEEWNQLDPKKVAKPLRQIAKNKFVFAEFYGDYHGQIAPNIWKDLQEPQYAWLRNHLGTKTIKFPIKDKFGKTRYIDRTITNLDVFTEHMKQVESRMWNRFATHKKWREDTNEFYKKKGYVESFMGFRESGYLRRNQLCNMPVQGNCFHLLLWALIQLNKWMKENKCKSELIGQIHDSLVFNIWPDEMEMMKKKIYEVMCVDTKKNFDFIGVVPLDVEFDVYPETWAKAI